MRLSVVILALAPAALMAETRCGWIDNPTPANWWLTDRDGEWTLMLLGAGDRNGFVDAPWDGDFGEDWIETNGHYGYGCACFEGAVDRATGWATQVSRLAPLPLARCTGDPALPPR